MSGERPAVTADEYNTLLVRAVAAEERARKLAAAVGRLKEAEAIDAKMGYPLPGDSALAVYLCSLYELLDRNFQLDGDRGRGE